MANLKNDKYTVIIGGDVDSEFETREDAEGYVSDQKEKWPLRIYQITDPEEVFSGTGWSWSDSIGRV